MYVASQVELLRGRLEVEIDMKKAEVNAINNITVHSLIEDDI